MRVCVAALYGGMSSSQLAMGMMPNLAAFGLPQQVNPSTGFVTTVPGAASAVCAFCFFESVVLLCDGVRVRKKKGVV